jgi:hypothetical protein
MKLDITDMLTKSVSPFYGIVSGNAAISLGLVVLPVTFGAAPSTSSSRLRISKPPIMPSSADQLSPSSWRHPLHLLGTQDVKSCRSTHTARALEDILRLRHRSRGTRSDQSSTQCNDGTLRCFQETPTELEIPKKTDMTNKPQPSEEVQVKAIDLRTGDNSKTTMIGWALTRNRKTRSSASSGLAETSSCGNQQTCQGRPGG